jgi:glycosyltransferase involved in cell wall biosynthesis
VITRAKHKEIIEQTLGKEPMPNVHWVYYELPRWIGFWQKGKRGVHPYYYLWQICVYLVGKQLHREVGFDLVHHVTLVKYWMPSFLSLLPVPFIWGPIGGGESCPRIFFKAFSLRGKVHEYFRNLGRWIGEADPFVRLTAKRATLAFATTQETEERLRRLGCRRIKVSSCVKIPEDEITSLASTPPRNTDLFRLVSIGRLIHWKGFHLGLAAFAQFQQRFPQSEYYIIGDGSERRNLEQLAQKFGVAKKIRFWGNIPRVQVLAKLTECDLLVHPSLHEPGGYVCLEAMAAGRPVLCLDLGGPALQVTEATGIKVPARDPEQVVKDLAEAMLRLAWDFDLRVRMGKAGQERAHYWQHEDQNQVQLYEEIVGRA